MFKAAASFYGLVLLFFVLDIWSYEPGTFNLRYSPTRFIWPPTSSPFYMLPFRSDLCTALRVTWFCNWNGGLRFLKMIKLIPKIFAVKKTAFVFCSAHLTFSNMFRTSRWFYVTIKASFQMYLKLEKIQPDFYIFLEVYQLFDTRVHGNIYVQLYIKYIKSAMTRCCVKL